MWTASNPVARELDNRWQETQMLFQQFWVEADIDTKMYTGQQSYLGFGPNANVNYRNQKQLQFNKILRIVNMVGGYQRDNRLASVIIPSDNDKDIGETADQRTTVLDWVHRQDQTYERISDCFDGSIVCGLNLLQIWMDFREDPENGEIKTRRIPFNAFLMDPYWTDPSLKTDCNWIWTRNYVTKDQLLSLIPTIEKDLPSLGKGYATKDGKFQFLAQNWNTYQMEMYAYDEYWTRTYREGRKLIDKRTGELADWHGNKEQFEMLRQINPNVELIKASVPTVKWHILVNNNLVYEEESPYGLDRFPFVPYSCYHFPEVQNYAYRYQGIVRNIRDAQVELNRRRNRLLDIMDAQIQSGLMLKENALVNPEDAFFQGPGKILFFKQDANLATDAAPIPPPPVAPGWQELIASIEKEIMDIVGPEELFAQNMGAKEMTGVLMKLKMGAGLTGLRNIFDRLNQAQMYTAEIMDDLIVNNFSEGKVRQIIGKEPTKDFFDREFNRFNCTVEELELTATQRQLKFLQAMQFKQLSPDAIDDAYLLKVSTLQDKKELVEAAQQRAQQAQQMQQAQMQQQMEQQEIVTRSIEAKAQNDYSAAQERQARAVSDIALAKERASQAVHDRAAAALDNARAIKEMYQLDENRLMDLARFILELQQSQKAISGGEEEDSVTEAQKLSVPNEMSKMESKPSTLSKPKPAPAAVA